MKDSPEEEIKKKGGGGGRSFKEIGEVGRDITSFARWKLEIERERRRLS